LLWDGERFVGIAHDGYHITLFWLNEAGQILARTDDADLAINNDDQATTDGLVAITALAPGDYLIAYGMQSGLAYDRLAHLRLVP
jgi:hypothetical protein